MTLAITVDEAANILNMGPGSVRRLIKLGILKTIETPKGRRKSISLHSALMAAGIEPARPFGQGILNPPDSPRAIKNRV